MTTDTVTETTTEHPRSIWANIKLTIQALTGAITTTCVTLESVATVANDTVKLVSNEIENLDDDQQIRLDANKQRRLTALANMAD